MSSPMDLEARVSDALAREAARAHPPEPDWDALVTAVRRRRHTRMAMVAVAFVLVLATVIGVAASGIGRDTSSIAPATRGQQVAVDHPPAPVPEGWKPVTFGPVQFAVPQDWPVYDDGRCNNHSTVGVFLGLPSGGCSGTFSAITVNVLGYSGAPEPGTPVRTLNGLRAYVRQPDPVENRPNHYSVELPDEDVIIQLDFLDLADAATASQIIDSIGSAPDPRPIPIAPDRPEPVPTTKAGPPEWCTAVEAFRLSGAPVPDQLPYIERIRDAAPAELRPPVETVIAWLQQGAPTPPPEEVQQAQLQTTQDWIARCPTVTGTPVQVLNGSAVQGVATARTNDLKAEGWDTLPPSNAPALRDGTVVQCKNDHGEILQQHLVDSLRKLGIKASVEPIPKPLPTGYDPNANCWVILGR